MKIGVGITTRNRPDLLSCAMDHWFQYSRDIPIQYVIVDDASDQPLPKLPVDIVRLPTRKGIAYAKSACLSRLRDCDYIFLADDDMFPCQIGWEWPYILGHLTTGLHHFVYTEPLGIKPKRRFRRGMVTLEQYDSTGGVLLSLTKKVVQTVGGFYPNYRPYGFEHVGYSRRIHRAGLMADLPPYISLPSAFHFWWPVDFRGVPPGYSFEFSSSISSAEAKRFADENSYIYVHELNNARMFYDLPSV